ncbi:energy transducer TonB [Sphingomonas sp.]|uniref:energy transducer TonB n=1 Tax=Sphingomonas sp. TaxID=28214 RepID=UPI0028999D0E|nr:energy transducer TonB [Sphingomonas sp.]
MMIVAMAMATFTPQDEPKAQISGEVMRTLFGPDNYPPAALRAGEEGRVIVDLGIDASGRVTDCKVVETAAASLAEQTCRLAVRGNGLFSPAKDAGGKSIASRYSLRIRWQLPHSDESEMTADRPMAMRLVVEPNGHVLECEGGMPAQQPLVARSGPMCDGLARHLVEAITRQTGKPPAHRVEGRFLIDFAPNAAAHDASLWPTNLVLLNDMNVTYGVTSEGRFINCQRDLRLWEKGVPAPSPCDGQSQTGPGMPPAAAVSQADALLRLGYRFLPEG